MSKFVGTGHSSYKKRIYRAAVSQSLRNTTLDHAATGTGQEESGRGLVCYNCRTETEYANVCVCVCVFCVVLCCVYVNTSRKTG